MINKANVKDLYPLSPMQEGMLFHALNEPGSSAYFEQVSYRVRGPLQLVIFEKAWKYLFDRHDILRTAFLHERTKRPLQAVLRERTLPFIQLDLSHLDSAAQISTVAEHRAEEKRRGFDLRSDVLLRARVLTLATDDHEIILSFHHILMDGWCMGILHAEFLHAYQALEAGQSPSLPPVVPYQRYIQWLERQDKDAALSYWEGYLDGYNSPTLIPARRQREGTYDLRRLHAQLDAETTAHIGSIASSWGVTVSTLFQTAWAVVLSRYACANDVAFGAVVSGRPAEIPQVESILGLFINLIPVRAQVAPELDCRELAKSLQASFLDAAAFNYCPISEIAARSSLPQQLLDHILVFENYPDAGSVTTGDLTIEHTDRFEQTNYDFLIVIAPGETIDVAFHFNASAFDSGYMERLHRNYLHTLNRLLENPRLSDLDSIAPQEKQLLDTYNATAQISVGDAGISQLFDKCAFHYPQATAVVDQDVRWSYAQLNEHANAVAEVLRKDLTMVREERVAVLISRSRWLPATLIGALKAGTVYVPIDINDPPDRIRFLIEDCHCRAVLVTPSSPSLELPVPRIDITTLKPLSDAVASLPSDLDQLAYLIYTSGSTGKPKGVMVSQRAALNLVQWHQRTFSVDGSSRATIFASPAFDASIWEMLPYLLTGACLYVVPEDIRTDAEQLTQFLLNREITHAFVPPSVSEEIGRVHHGRLDEQVTLLTGGDVLRSTNGLESFAINNYGPTESAVVATSIPVHEAGTQISIGRPIDNTEILILDPQLRPAPIGVTGELYIASTSLARGYWNRPSLTAERFLPHPSQPSARMYRTGDMGYWQDGAIVFRGRNDHQVKVRGVRIELGEIEETISRSPRVAESAVGSDPDSGHLIAWVVPSDSSIDLSELRTFLSSQLPPSMIPAKLIVLPSLPRTRNGKLDRKALLNTAGAQERPLMLPVTGIQQKLAAIWSAVLAVPEIGIHENFFELGGHSLSVTRAVSRICDEFQVKLPIRAVFEAPTIAALEEKIQSLRNATFEDDDEPPLIARRREARQVVAQVEERG